MTTNDKERTTTNETTTRLEQSEREQVPVAKNRLDDAAVHMKMSEFRLLEAKSEAILRTSLPRLLK